MSRKAKKRPRRRRAPVTQTNVGPAADSPKSVTKWSRRTMVEAADQYRPRPAHSRYLRAYVDLLDEGAAVTYTNIARRMGISREHFARMRRRYPGMEAWVGEQIAAENAKYVGPVVRKLALLGRQGSLGHADLYLKVVAGALTRPLETGAGATVNNTGPMVVHIAVPRPGDPPQNCSQGTLSDLPSP